MFDRKHPIHKPPIERFNCPIIFFLTVCTKDRKPVLAHDHIHEMLIKSWESSAKYLIGRYIIMPDHIHLFSSPSSDESGSVQRWVSYWKRLVSIDLKEHQPLWQRDCWDTQIRHPSGYDEKWEYVMNNPVRKGLVRNADEWPYQGCLNDLIW